MTLPRARALGGERWRRLLARWFAGPGVQVFWVLATASAVVGLYMAAHTELIDAPFDRRVEADRIDETYHPPSGTGKGRSPGSYEYEYVFHDDRGVEHRGWSYSTNDVDEDEVEYVSADPSTARVVGTRSQSNPAPITILILGMALVFAGAAFLWAYRDGARAYDPARAYVHLAIVPALMVTLELIAIVVLLIPR